ncbi:Serine-threonine kinase receptor-associated protein [Galdieria sulphuraria]|nr:Serine-threonine kinase receptor-associated protein [Galdieria sulphuraria]
MKTIHVFDLTGGEKPEPISVLEGHKGIVRFARFFGSGHNLIVSGGDEPFLIVWDIRSGKPIQKLELDTSDIKSAQISKIGSTSMLSAVAANGLQFWDLDHFCKLDSMIIPQDSESASLSGNHVVVSGRDLQIRLYERNTKQLLNTFHGHHGPVWCVRFSPMGDSFASGSDDGTIRLWNDEYLHL